MVYKIKNWFVFEPGDEVFSLDTGKNGQVVHSRSLDLPSQLQFVDILFSDGVTENINTRNIDLVRRTEKKPSR